MGAQSIYKSSAGEQAIMALYDSILARWPTPYETFNVPTRHGDTFVIANGDSSATPLVLLHGAGSNSTTWAGDMVTYCRQYRVYAVDLLGEPGKSAPNRPAWAGMAYAEWLEDVLNALGIDKAILLGLSQGGWTAIKFAIYRPERVAKLVLLSPGGIVPDKLSFVVRAIPLSLLGTWGNQQIIRMVLGGQAVPEEVNQALTLIMTQFKTRLGVLPLFTDTELRRLTMPILLLMGEQDVLRDALKISSRMQSLTPQVTTIIVPKGGHALLNTPVQVLPFLAKTTST